MTHSARNQLCIVAQVVVKKALQRIRYVNCLTPSSAVAMNTNTIMCVDTYTIMYVDTYTIMYVDTYIHHHVRGYLHHHGVSHSPGNRIQTMHIRDRGVEGFTNWIVNAKKKKEDQNYVYFSCPFDSEFSNGKKQRSHVLFLDQRELGICAQEQDGTDGKIQLYDIKTTV